MTNKEYNAKIVNLFRRMKPLYEEWLAIHKELPNNCYMTVKTSTVIYDCCKPFFEGEALFYNMKEDLK